VTRIDWLVLRRFAFRVTLTIAVFFALFALVESLNTNKFRMLSSFGGPPLAVAAIVLSAIRSSIGVLPITVLIGTIAGVLDLQARRELTIVQATGHSIWTIARTPLIVAFVLTAVLSILGETAVVTAGRMMPGNSNSAVGVTWLEQTGEAGDYILQAQAVTANPPALQGVAIFMTGSNGRDRIEAAQASLAPGAWVFSDAVKYTLDAAPERLVDFQLATETTLGDLGLIASGARDLTLPELLATAATHLSNASYRSVTLTSLFRTFTLPLMVAGTMLIGIATAAGYRRKLQYANTILLGIVGGFVVFTLNEMAIRAGNADVLPPLIATFGPALVSIIIGLTALLYSQDGAR
jgi:lipopolysaccharide export system permease protein